MNYKMSLKSLSITKQIIIKMELLAFIQMKNLNLYFFQAINKDIFQ